jgi:hypothetical protein
LFYAKMAQVLSGEKPAIKGQISWHIPPFKMFLFFEEGKCSCASFWGRLSSAQAIVKTLRLPPLSRDEANHGKGIRKGGIQDG